jgi:hypothetical protein
MTKLKKRVLDEKSVICRERERELERDLVG